MLKAINNLKKAAEQITPEFLMRAIANDRSLMDLIIRLNTQEQLYKKGIDATGKALGDIGGDYSFYTAQLKADAGVEYRHVTLRDTGEFYESFRVVLDGNSDLQVLSDPIKDGVNLFDRWGEHVLGLTNENLALFRAAILPIVQRAVKTQLKLAA